MTVLISYCQSCSSFYDFGTHLSHDTVVKDALLLLLLLLAILDDKLLLAALATKGETLFMSFFAHTTCTQMHSGGFQTVSEMEIRKNCDNSFIMQCHLI